MVQKTFLGDLKIKECLYCTYQQCDDHFQTNRFQESRNIVRIIIHTIFFPPLSHFWSPLSEQGMSFNLTVASQCKEPSGILIQRAHPGGNGSCGPQTGTARCSSYSPKHAAVDWASSAVPLWCHQRAPGARRERSIRQEGVAAGSPHRTSSDPAAETRPPWTCRRNERKRFTPCSKVPQGYYPYPGRVPVSDNVKIYHLGSDLIWFADTKWQPELNIRDEKCLFFF